MALVIGPATTCGGLLGVRAGDMSLMGSYNAPGGFNLAGTTSFYLRFNLWTRNRGPRTLGWPSTIANIPITKPHNGFERFYQSGFTVCIRERSFHYTVIEILDYALESVMVYGGGWQVKLDFAVEEAEGYAGPINDRALMAQNNRSLLGGPNIAAG